MTKELKPKKADIMEARRIVAGAFRTICTIRFDELHGSDYPMATFSMYGCHVTFPEEKCLEMTTHQVAEHVAKVFACLLVREENTRQERDGHE